MKNKKSIFMSIAGICLAACIATACSGEREVETTALVETIEETTEEETTELATEKDETISAEEEIFLEDAVDEADDSDEEVPEGELSALQKELLTIITNKIVDQLDLWTIYDNFPNPSGQPINSEMTFIVNDEVDANYVVDCIYAIEKYMWIETDEDKQIFNYTSNEYGNRLLDKESTLKRVSDIFNKAINEEDIVEYNLTHHQPYDYDTGIITIGVDTLSVGVFYSDGELWDVETNVNLYTYERINDDQAAVSFPYFVDASELSHPGKVTVILNINADSFWGYNIESLTAEIPEDYYILLPDPEMESDKRADAEDTGDPFFGKRIYFVSPLYSYYKKEIIDDLTARFESRGSECSWVMIKEGMLDEVTDLIKEFDADTVVLVSPYTSVTSIWADSWEDLIGELNSEGIAVFCIDALYMNGMKFAVNGQGSLKNEMEDVLTEQMELFYEGEDLEKKTISLKPPQ